MTTIMTKHIKCYIIPFIFTLFFASCSDERNSSGVDGEGKIVITPSLAPTLTEKSSRTVDEEALMETLNIVISKSNGDIVKYWTPDNNGYQSEFTLSTGNYTIEGWAGDSVPASFTSQFFKGKTTVTVEKDITKEINLDCRIANVAFKVNISESVKEILSDYNLTVRHVAGELTFKDDNLSSTGYFMMPKGDKNLKWILTGTLKGGTKLEKTGEIENALSGYLYTLNVEYTAEEDTPQGGAFIDPDKIQFNEVTVPNETSETIGLRTKPVIEIYEDVTTGKLYDSSRAITKSPDAVYDIVVLVRSSGHIYSVKLQNEGFSSFLGADELELYEDKNNSILTHYQDLLKLQGFEWENLPNNESQTSSFRLTLKSDFTSKLEEGDYTFTVTATDEDWRYYIDNSSTSQDSRTTTLTFKLSISDSGAQIVTADVAEQLSLWDDEMLLKAEILKPEVSNVTFKYKKTSETEWTTIPGESGFTKRDQLPKTVNNSSGNFRYAIITDIESGVEYQYKIEYNGQKEEEKDKFETFTPNFSKTQLPNSGFEDWCQPSKSYYAATSTSDLFWDSGNDGATTLSANSNLTTPESTIKNSGDYSAQLKSNFVGLFSMGKFAAGNIFIGKFLDTDGMNGILGWGRPFSNRPKTLKLWVRYSQTNIGYRENNAPDEYKNGDPDKGIVYIALLTKNCQQGDYNNSKNSGNNDGGKFPVVIHTGDNPQLFNPEGNGVIAYGEYVIDENITEWTQLEIPIEYKLNSERPYYILLTASASKGGDYFTGGAGSTLWLDDLELVY